MGATCPAGDAELAMGCGGWGGGRVGVCAVAAGPSLQPAGGRQHPQRLRTVRRAGRPRLRSARLRSCAWRAVAGCFRVFVHGSVHVGVFVHGGGIAGRGGRARAVYFGLWRHRGERQGSGRVGLAAPQILRCGAVRDAAEVPQGGSTGAGPGSVHGAHRRVPAAHQLQEPGELAGLWGEVGRLTGEGYTAA
jgi:hypothetical protein